MADGRGEFDFVIVGAGSVGCVVARCLVDGIVVVMPTNERSWLPGLRAGLQKREPCSIDGTHCMTYAPR